MSDYWNKKLIREQLDERIKNQSLGDLPQDGFWIKTIREALGMSTKQLAAKIGIDQSRVSRLENAEAEGKLMLSSLRKVAEALDMKFVYGFVPKGSLEEMVEEQAQKIARKRMNLVNHHMRLEQQELADSEKEKSFEDLVKKILIEDNRDFWEQ